MAKYELKDNVIQNIFTFLNRLKYDGFNEVDAIQEIRILLSNPIKEEDNNETNES